MPNKLPIKARARAVKVGESAKARARAKAAEKPVDWLSLWAMSFGVAAVVVAWIADRTIGGNIGAAFILSGAAGLIGLMLATARKSG